MTPFDLRAWVATTIKLMAGPALAKGLRLASVVGPDVPTVVIGDPNRLQQIVVNLIGNAIKFTGHGEVTLTVETEPMRDARSVIRFSVSDTGIGVPKERQDAIFLAFVQADGSTTRRYGGTGLGLSICRDLVRLMGGRLWMESEVGQGSTFRFNVSFDLPPPGESPLEIGRPLPLRNEDAKVATVHDGPRSSSVDYHPAANVPRETRQALRILLAVHDRVNQLIASRLLERSGHTVVVSGSGAGTLAALDRQGSAEFDLLLLDVQLPDINGLEITGVVRAREAGTGQHLPIIAITGIGKDGDPESFLAAGMDGCISLPIHATQLFETIDTLFR